MASFPFQKRQQIVTSELWSLEQFFNPEIVSFSLLCAGIFLLLNSLYLISNQAALYFFDWDPIEATGQQGRLREKSRRLALLSTLAENNYLYLIFWYWLIDVGTIFPTAFEFLCYLLTFFAQSLALSLTKLTEKFIAEVIDAQILFTLQKDTKFKVRAFKITVLTQFLTLQAALSTLFLLGLLYDAKHKG